MISIANVVIELSCLFFALFYFRTNQTQLARITIGYIVMVCVMEIFGISWSMLLHKSNAWIYNIFIIFEAAYISYGLYAALKPSSQKARVYCITAYTIFLFVYLLEWRSHGFFRFNSKAILVSSILFALLSLYYFYLLIRDKEAINLKHSSSFWWVAGVYIYYFGGTIYNLFLQNSINSTIALTYIMIFLNLLLYSIWTYSFICSSRTLN